MVNDLDRQSISLHSLVILDEERHGGSEGGDGQAEGEGSPGRHEEGDCEGAGVLLLQHLQHALHSRHRSPHGVRQVPSERRPRAQPERKN